MPYLQTIPKPSDKLKISQADILANFQEIDAFISINHVDFNTPNQGKHNLVTMPPAQTGSPTTLVNEGALLNSINPSFTSIQFVRNQNHKELLFRRENNGNFINLTSNKSNANTDAGFAYIGNSLIKWGTASVSTESATAFASFYTNTDIPQFKTPPFVFIELLYDVRAKTISNEYILNSNIPITIFGFYVSIREPYNKFNYDYVPYLAIGT